MNLQVAFVGLGRMGSGIVENILKRGFAVTVWNRTQSKMAPAIGLGAKGAKSLREAVAEADVVITSLMDDVSIQESLQGPDGILAGLRPGAIHLCIATISPKFADGLDRLHKEHGTRYLSGPVVGRPDAARAGELTSYIAGGKSAVAIVEPIVAAYSKSVKFVSETPRDANIIKLCINYSVVTIIELIGEAYALAEKSGADPAVINDFYQVAFAHPALKMYGNKILKRDFDSQGGFSMLGGKKDVTLMLQAAKEVGATLEIGEIINGKMEIALNGGMENRDWSAVSEISRRNAGLA